MQKEENNPTFSKTGALNPFHLELDKTLRGFSLTCSGVRGISEVSDTEIKMRLHGFSILIVGTGLYMTVFEGKCVEVIGKFLEVRFLYGKS